MRVGCNTLYSTKISTHYVEQFKRLNDWVIWLTSRIQCLLAPCFSFRIERMDMFVNRFTPMITTIYPYDC